jgi:23S rRNA (cytosine1962-C5)-methyltransferase
VDYHPPVLLLSLFRELPSEVYQSLVAGLSALLVPGQVLAVQQRAIPGDPVTIEFGELPEAVFAQAAGLRYQLRIGDNQNIGYFLDMKPLHAWLAERAKGQRVLNLFAYTCAFSVAAVAGGAEQVVNVDMSSGALKTGAANHRLNGLDSQRSQFLKLNILKSWGRIRRAGPYDWLIIDPPSRQKGSFDAERDYGKVLRRIPELAVDGAHVLACLNAPHLPQHFLQQMMAEHCPQCEFIERMPASAEFPEQDPDKGLKVLLFRYRTGE